MTTRSLMMLFPMSTYIVVDHEDGWHRSENLWRPMYVAVSQRITNRENWIVVKLKNNSLNRYISYRFAQVLIVSVFVEALHVGYTRLQV